MKTIAHALDPSEIFDRPATCAASRPQPVAHTVSDVALQAMERIAHLEQNELILRDALHEAIHLMAANNVTIARQSRTIATQRQTILQLQEMVGDSCERRVA